MANSPKPQNDSDWEKKAFLLGKVFRPSAPVEISDLFAGRKQQIMKVCDTINETGRHAILYGERGVGKTSCANMIFPRLYSTGNLLLIPQVNCMAKDTFGDIWRRVLEEIKIKLDDSQEHVAPPHAQHILDAYGGAFAEKISPDVVRRLLHELAKEFLVVVVLDEFDTIKSPETRQAVADLIKFLSDRVVPATIIIIGVADDVDGLIGDHRSVERCMSQIPIPRMTRDELELVVTNGLRHHGMTIQSTALQEISRIARGLPHYAHLLGLHAGRMAIENKTLGVVSAHLSSAISTALTDIQASTLSDYAKAIASARQDAIYKQVLLAASMVEPDDLGYFSPKDLRSSLTRIRGKPCGIDTYMRHLNAFCDAKRGPVLSRNKRTDVPRFRFTNPLLQPYVLLRGLAEKLVDEEDLQQTRNFNDPQQRLF